MPSPCEPLSFPELYERTLVGPMFGPWAEVMLQEAALAAGDRVLDVACGTGIVARLAQRRVGAANKVVGVDASAAMLAVARAAAPGIDWREGDAAALPLHDDEQFDAVFCQQGLQFFADRPAAVRQMRRALAPGGRLALSTWRPDTDVPFLRALRGVAERHLGPVTDRRHGFGEAGPIEALLADAGFREVRVRTRSLATRFDDAAVFVHLNTLALVGMHAGAKAWDEAQRAAVVAAIERDSAGVPDRHRDGGALVFELAANVVTARA